jgi:hypothetical protein
VIYHPKRTIVLRTSLLLRVGTRFPGYNECWRSSLELGTPSRVVFAEANGLYCRKQYVDPNSVMGSCIALGFDSRLFVLSEKLPLFSSESMGLELIVGSLVYLNRLYVLPGCVERI